MDFGTGEALAIHGPAGPVPKRDLQLPRVPGGKVPADEFRLMLTALMEMGDVVVESPTVGSSGCEIGDVRTIVADSTNTFYTLSARSVKNFRKDYGLGWDKGARYAKDGDIAPPGPPPPHTGPVLPPAQMQLFTQASVHKKDAALLYIIATMHPHRLRVWHEAEELERTHTSVRPMDKRGYRDETSDAYMRLLPPFALLPPELREVLGSKTEGDYRRALIMPFAMALTEPFLAQAPAGTERKRFEKILGLYDHGYPSFYRRMTVVWMQENAKRLARVTKMDEVPPATRKAAWKITQRQIRWLFHLSA